MKLPLRALGKVLLGAVIVVALVCFIMALDYLGSTL